MRMPDVSDRVPVRRMSVARGRIAGIPEPQAHHLVAAQAVAAQAAKSAALWVPSAVPAHLTDAFCELQVMDGGVEATMTVQGLARTVLATSALAGVAAALLCLFDAAGHPEGARIADLAVVQDVEG
jgi:molybdenum cofactor biosynthesis enzyme